MQETLEIKLTQNIIDTQEEMYGIFKDSKLFMVNNKLLQFFKFKNIEEFNGGFRKFSECFMPHPSYFNTEKIPDGETWLSAIVKLDVRSRVVSMMNPSYEPFAFSVSVSNVDDEYSVAKFTDVTKTLIKSILIENDASLDKKSGAYDKKYFLHISELYEESARFNEKMIGIIKIVQDDKSQSLESFVSSIKKIIREDDMIIRWGENSFLLVHFLENEANQNVILKKLGSIDNINKPELNFAIKKKDESINKLLKRLD
ncbi:hypothetical protein [Sulfurimonas sp.]|jgi:hypothetical protein|uniref:hypothetical protein n=1 Tax=Sulfurimonas sp. TaxID=2022749 RepID=UPI0025DE14BE|nr:hypothetical protein [Sulfurimonas sp.]MBT5935930.1 hypothetical protein [Sulfurimonas sp.]